MDAVAYRADDLTRLAAGIFAAYGVPDQDAHLVADSLVVAELWGHASHGLLRLPWYTARLRSGVMKPDAQLTIDHDRGALVAASGHAGVGQVITDQAMRLAVERARQFGIGAVGVRDSNHFGTAAYFTRRAAAEGMAAILTTNGSPAIAPWGGLDKVVGANPWSFAAPDGFGGVTVLDIANSGVARGKIYAAAEKGLPIPEGWALDPEGRPTTDPAAALASGTVLPMAGHKGYAISFLIDVFSGVLTGAAFGTGVGGPYQPDTPSQCGHLAIAIDIEGFQPRSAFEESMRELIGQVRASRRAPGVDRLYYPGELEEATAAGRTTVTLPAATIESLHAEASAVGAALPEEA